MQCRAGVGTLAQRQRRGVGREEKCSLFRDLCDPGGSRAREEAPTRRDAVAMPTTRAARAAARCLTEVLPEDALGLVLYQLPLAHDIAATSLTCHALDNAAKIALKLRPFSSEVVPIPGVMTGVERAVALPDGRFIIGTSDGEIKMCNGSFVHTINAHTDMLRGLVVLPDGRFVSSSNDDTAKLWRSNGELERTFEEDGLVGSVAALPDGVHFVVGLFSGALKLYHIDGTLVHVFEHEQDLEDEDDDIEKGLGHSDYVNALAVTRDGQHIISGSSDCSVIVWSVATKKIVGICDEHPGEVWSVEAMPDGQRFLSGSNDETVRVWLIDGTLQNTFSELHDSTVMALVALPDNQHALSGGSTLFEYEPLNQKNNKSSIQLFNVNTGAVLRTFMHHTRSVNSLALMPDGLRFISGSDDETACIVYHGLAPQ